MKNIIFVPESNIPENKFRNLSSIYFVFSFFFGAMTFVLPLLSIFSIFFGILSFLKNKKMGIVSLLISLISTMIGFYIYGWENFSIAAFAYLFFVLGPIVFWFIYIRWLDKSESEPLKLQYKVFLFGCFGIIIAIFLNESLSIFGLDYDVEKIKHFDLFSLNKNMWLTILPFFLAGPIEEFIKYVILRTSAFTEKPFNQIFDGALYGMTVGLGFSFIENTYYYFSFTSSDFDSFFSVIVFRGLTTTLLHIIATGILGYYLAKSKFIAKGKIKLLLTGFIFASLLHGLFNTFVFFNEYLSVFILVISALILFKKMNKPESRIIWTAVKIKN